MSFSSISARPAPFDRGDDHIVQSSSARRAENNTHNSGDDILALVPKTPKKSPGLLVDRGSLAVVKRFAIYGLSTCAALLTGGAVARAQTMPEVVARPGILQKGEGRVSFGAGTYLRDGGNFTAAQLDLRYGLADRLEIRILLPGIAYEALRETDTRPGVIGFLAVSEVGFNSIHGSTFAYQVGVRVTKRIGSRVRLSANVELRHRLIGQENAELVVIGPLPPNRAGVFVGELMVQLHRMAALTGSFGYTLSIGEGKSFGYGSVGGVLSIAKRLDLFTQLFLERSRPDRVFTPAFFGGLTLSY